jgi:hypothetical protein
MVFGLHHGCGAGISAAGQLYFAGGNLSRQLALYPWFCMFKIVFSLEVLPRSV